MTSIVTRTGKGSELSYAEMDGNLDSLNGINEAQTGTTYTVAAADQNRTIEFSNASPIAVTLTAIATLLAAGDTSDFKVTLKNIGAGAVTVTRGGTDTFDGGATAVVLETGHYITIQSDSTGAIWNIVNGDYTQTFTDKTLTSPTINTPTVASPDIDQVVDSSGNEVVIYGEVASAVNEITVTNAASGNTPSINQSGTDNVGISIEGVSLNNGNVACDDLVISDIAGAGKIIHLQTSGSERWVVWSDTTAETGSNAGSDFAILRYDDSGTVIDSVFSITRSTGTCVIPYLDSTSVGNSAAGLAVGAVGTYAWLGETALTLTAAGGTRAGSALRYAGISTSDGWNAVDRTINWGHGVSTAISGTWRCMGYSYSDTTTDYPATLWLRIS